MSRRRVAPVAPHGLDGALDAIPLTLAGHPFAPIGMGEQLRSHLAACRAVRLDAHVFDVFRHAARTDPAHVSQMAGAERASLPGGIRIFHINGDEIEPTLAELAARGASFEAGYNIVVPAWELPVYPAAWATLLRRFDEVWALSSFIQAGLAAAGIDAPLIGQSIEPAPGALLPRRFFGLRESAVVLLTMFDLTSYTSRKNPDAVLAMFDRITREQPFRDIQLVVKVKDGERGAPGWVGRLDDPRIRVMTEPLDSMAVRSLLAACDVFVSLHRSEGFGRGLGEAMALGRLAMGTGWSGNADFMTDANALLVGHRLVPVGRHYPHGEGQHWAEADVDHAAALLAPMLDDPARARAMAERGRADVLASHGHRAVGLRLLDRLEHLATGTALHALLRPKRPSRRHDAGVA